MLQLLREGIISKITRAKPDVIHYVDSPKIYRREKAEPKSTNIKGNVQYMVILKQAKVK